MKTLFSFLLLGITSASAQYRMVQGRIYSLGDVNAGWVRFGDTKQVCGFTKDGGLILQSYRDETEQTGSVFDGHYHSATYANHRIMGLKFILENYPQARQLNLGDTFDQTVYAMRVAEGTVTSGPSSVTTWNGTYGSDVMKTYDDPEGISIYDCGLACNPPARILTPAELAALHKKQLETDRKTFLWLESKATNGVAFAQCELGEHYLNGVGTETNREEGIKWLQIAASQGDLESSNLLANIFATNSVAEK